ISAGSLEPASADELRTRRQAPPRARARGGRRRRLSSARLQTRTLRDNRVAESSEGGRTMDVQQLQSTAQALVAEGKGILAADESDGTIKKRFDSIGVESTEDNRRAYRELLFATEG